MMTEVIIMYTIRNVDPTSFSNETPAAGEPVRSRPTLPTD